MTLKNRYGLHARPIKMFVDVTNSCAAEVTVRKGDRVVNGKSILEMMTLAAAMGAELEIVAKGPDAERAIADLKRLVESKFEEE